MFCRISLRTPCPCKGSRLRLVWRELGYGILRRKANGGNQQERPDVGEFGTGHGSSPPRWKANAKWMIAGNQSIGNPGVCPQSNVPSCASQPQWVDKQARRVYQTKRRKSKFITTHGRFASMRKDY